MAFENTETSHLAFMRRELLQRRIRAATVRQFAPAEIPKVERDGLAPLSFAQQRLWFLDRYESGSAVYNIPIALRLEGPVDLEVLRSACNEVIRRHEALRTVFVEREGVPYQVIAAQLELDLPVQEITGLAEEERKRELQRLLKQEASRPFDLASGPLIRIGLIRLSERQHVLAVTLHHIVGDGWSIGVLMKELRALYGAFRRGEPSPLAELPIQYADYAHWQREWLQSELLREQVSYWKGQLAGAPALLELPSDRPRPALQSYRGSTLRFGLPKDLTEKLNALARAKGVTLFTVLTAAFQVLLQRYTGQEDICIGTPVANRNRQELEGLIGFFVNMLVLRSKVSAEDSFEELLKRVRSTALEAYAHQELPFEKLVEELNPPRSLSHSPLFQVALILQNTPRGKAPGAHERFRPVASDAGVSKFDLTLSLSEGRERLFAEMIGQWDEVWNKEVNSLNEQLRRANLPELTR